LIRELTRIKDELPRILLLALIIFLCGVFNSNAEENVLKLDLDDCKGIAINNNTELLEAEEDIKKSKGYLLEQFSDFLPEVYLDYRYVATSSPEAGRIADDVFLYAESTATIRMKEDIFRGGERVYKYRSARLAVDKAKESYMSIRDKLLFDVKTAYYDLLLAEELISLYGESKRRMEAYTSKITRKSKVGDVTKYAVLRANIEIEIMNSDLINIEKERILYKVKMQKLLMLDEIQDISTKEALLYPAKEIREEDCSLERLLRAAEKKNRRLKVAGLSKKIGKEGINIATSRGGLRASLRSSLYKSSDKFNLMSHYYYDWSIMINVSVPLFDGLKIPALINQSRSEYSMLVASETTTRKDVFWETEDAVNELQKTKPLLESQRRLAKNAEDGVNMVLVLYDRGESSEWDIIDAHRNYIRAETNLARFIRDYKVLAAKIKYLISEE